MEVSQTIVERCMQNARDRSVQVVVVAPTLLRWGLERMVLDAQPRLELLGALPGLDECVAFVERQPPDVIVLATDVAPLETLAAFSGKVPAKVLLVTASDDAAWVDGAVMGGVRGVVRLTDTPAALVKAIEKINDGELWVDRGATSRIFMEMVRRKAAGADDPDQSRIATLTLRERQTIAAVTSDASAPAKVIASRLCISEHTLRNHLTSIYSKLGLSSRLDLYAYATRHRLHEMV
jgi:two-component system, NarL family, nitrate/nitrite response regulator NarL